VALFVFDTHSASSPRLRSCILTLWPLRKHSGSALLLARRGASSSPAKGRPEEEGSGRRTRKKRTEMRATSPASLRRTMSCSRSGGQHGLLWNSTGLTASRPLCSTEESTFAVQNPR
ncbi:unnamed protein product, partial [Musa hybrid cultivar]